jgi:hypothetical protein
VTFQRAGTGTTLTTYSDNDYTGATMIAGGVLDLRDEGALSGTTHIDINFGQLTINNRDGRLNMDDRVNDAATIDMRGGTIVFIARAHTTSSETLGDVTLVRGFNMIQAALATTVGVSATWLTLNSLQRSAGSTATLRFPDSPLGLVGTSGHILINTLNGESTAVEGGGLTNNLIGPWAVVDREFASYIPTLGVGRLGQTGFAGYAPVSLNGTVLTGSPQVTDNLRVTAVTPALVSVVTINTLTILNPVTMTLNLGGNTLTLAGGGLIMGARSDPEPASGTARR